MQTQKATFAAGCFWGVEARFSRLPGVINTLVGYTGGHLAEPTYKQVCSGETGHAEAIEVTFNPEQISFSQLLDAFWEMHDPTSLNRQGPDIGEQYRSAIFYHTSEQLQQALAAKQVLEEQHKYQRPITTEITAATVFYPAEEYHQQYLAKHGGGDYC